MVLRSGKVILTSLLTMILLTSLSSFTTYSSIAISNYKYIKSLRFYAPAIYVDEEGIMHGVATEIQVGIAWPGQGTVYFSAEPLTQIDMQAASRVAAMIASIYAGVPLHSYDYFIRVKSESEVVGGPSASGFTATALLALLTNTDLLPNVSMTGMIEPDGTIGPVGGIPEKLRAMASMGIKVFLIPKGQSIVKEMRRVVENRTVGNTVIISERIVPVKVNVTELGKKLGVKVLEVGSVAEAYKYLTGKELKIPKYTYSYPPWLTEWLKKIVKRTLRNANESIRGISSNLGPEINSLVVSVENHIRKARQLLSKGKYYSAASEAFVSAILSSYIKSVSKVMKAKSVAEAVSIIKNEVENYVDKTRLALKTSLNELKKLSRLPITDVRLQLAIAAYIRYRDANETIASLSNYPLYPLSPGQDALYMSIYAYWRAQSALNYLNLALNTGIGRELDKFMLSKGISTLLHFAMSVEAYLRSLGGRTYHVNFNKVIMLLERGELFDASSLVVESLTNNVMLMHTYYGTVKELAPYAREGAEVLIGRAQELGLTPVLPILYMERASTLNDTTAKMRLYEASSAYSLLLINSIPYKGNPIKVGTSTPSPTTITKTTTLPPITSTTTVTTTKIKTYTAPPSTLTQTYTTTATLTKTIRPRSLIEELISTGVIALLFIVFAMGLALGALIGFATSKR